MLLYYSYYHILPSIICLIYQLDFFMSILDHNYMNMSLVLVCLSINCPSARCQLFTYKFYFSKLYDSCFSSSNFGCTKSLGRYQCIKIWSSLKRHKGQFERSEDQIGPSFHLGTYFITNCLVIFFFCILTWNFLRRVPIILTRNGFCIQLHGDDIGQQSTDGFDCIARKVTFQVRQVQVVPCSHNSISFSSTEMLPNCIASVASAHFSCFDLVRWLAWAAGKICVPEQFVDSDVGTREL